MRKVVKYLYHNIICFVLRRIGADRLLRNIQANRRLIIMYHGVRNTNNRINGRHITAEQFEKHLVYYKQNFNIVPLRDLCDSRNITSHTIALSFDDGFLNNLTVALPLLEKHGVPATFFICSAGLDDPSYLHPTDRIDLARISSDSHPITINGIAFYRDGQQAVRSRSGVYPYQYINDLPFPKWLDSNAELANQIDPEVAKQNNDLVELIDGSSLARMGSNKLVTIGSHSHHHVNLTSLTPDELVDQLTTSKLMLGKHVTPVDMIAFPYGYFNSTTILKARELKYKYLIAGGSVDASIGQEVFPRIGILDGQGFSYAMLMINRGFRKFGF